MANIGSGRFKTLNVTNDNKQKRFYHPGTFVLDRFKGLNQWEKSIALIKRQNLKYSSETGVILSIILDQLMTEWVIDAIESCPKNRITIQVKDFIVRNKTDKEEYLSDRFYYNGGKLIKNLIPLILNFESYHNALRGDYDPIPRVHNKENNKENNKKITKKITRK